MSQATAQTQYFLYLDDRHAADPLFLQSLGRALAGVAWPRGPILVHGSGEAAERMLEAKGIFRERRDGVLMIQSASEAALVEQGIRRLNQKIVEILIDAVVSSVGILGTQRRALVVRDGSLRAEATWIHRLAEKGIVTVLGAFAQNEEDGSAGEIALWESVEALASSFNGVRPEVVFFTKTNLPGIMEGGRPLPEIDPSSTAVNAAVDDRAPIDRISGAGLPVLLTNTTRFADPGGAVGTRIPPRTRA